MTDKNYTQLQAMYDEFAESRGLKILAFPCNQFGGQACCVMLLTFGFAVSLTASEFLGYPKILLRLH